MLRWLPIAVTAGRGLAGPVVAVLVATGHAWPAFWLFCGAALTDLIDGWLARTLGSDRQLGALIDPLADKLLGASAWLTLLAVGWCPWWLAGPLLARDVVVASLWWRHRERGVVWEANRVGQVATCYEGTAIGVLLFHGPWMGVHWPSVGVVIGLHGLVLSAISALQYLIEGPPAPTAAPVRLPGVDAVSAALPGDGGSNLPAEALGSR